MQTKKNINIQVAANDKLVAIENTIQNQREWLATICILAGASMLGLTYPTAILAIIYLGWKHFKTIKEANRVKTTYDL